MNQFEPEEPVAEPAMFNRLAPLTHLKKCALWEGSNLHISAQYQGVTYRDLVKRARELIACLDKTDNEDELLLAIIETLLDVGYIL